MKSYSYVSFVGLNHTARAANHRFDVIRKLKIYD